MTKRHTTRLLGMLLPLAVLSACESGREEPRPAQPPQVGTTGELVLDLVDGTKLSEFLKKFPSVKPSSVRWNSPNVADEGICVIQASPARQAELLRQLQGDPLVESAEPNSRFTIEPVDLNSTSGSDLIPDDDEPPARDTFPNDPFYEKQWNMEMVGARGAWRYATGEDVIVAVIDTGVAYEDGKGLWAPDLKRTRFVAGYDFVNDDKIAADDHGHGTHCAGTVAQSTHNGRGVVGLARACQIMPLKVLSAEGWGTTSDIADAIRFAADHGAHVLSLSLGGGGHSQIMADAVAYARAKGCAVVCAAGNSGRGTVEYPAAYPGAIAVSSVGRSGQLAFYSSYGKRTFIAAPGGDKREGAEGGVLQNTLDPSAKTNKTVYAYWQGTSMATPHVAAACALLYEAGVTRPDGMEAVLRATARTPAKAGSSGWTPRYGWGVLDAGAAVRYATFLPGFLALGLTALLLVFTVRRPSAKHLSWPLLFGGALMGAGGLFFLLPFGLGELPLVGGFLTRSVADWDSLIMGPSWHWCAPFASALIPGLLGLVTLKSKTLRALTLGLALGWASRLVAGMVLPYTDVLWIPGQGILDALWLGVNAGILLAVAAVFVRLGRGKDGAATVSL